MPLKFVKQFESPETRKFEYQKSEPYLYILLDPQLVNLTDCVIISRLNDTLFRPRGELVVSDHQ